MTYWPFWLGGIFLAAVPVLHWFLLHRMFAVSGRFSALTDWLRRPGQTEPALTPDELARLLAAETAEEFGADALIADSEPAPAAVTVAAPAASGPRSHLVFFAAVAVGGATASWLATGAMPRAHWPGGLFVHLFGGGVPRQLAVLFGGGVLVGFGTRMAGGCTSGHGLCGVSRLQPGSLVATACFFGMGVVVSYALRALLGGG